ncbi:MAG TPA: hypothetical protein VFN53_08535, partial [Acidobacteriaceae bacterium]|nr:hypothetical protein [Acidobacteriaceae bacterium]
MMKMDAVLAHGAVFRGEGLPTVLCGKTLDQLGIGVEFLFSAVELLFAAQYYFCTPLNRVHGSADS